MQTENGVKSKEFKSNEVRCTSEISIPATLERKMELLESRFARTSETATEGTPEHQKTTSVNAWLNKEGSNNSRDSSKSGSQMNQFLQSSYRVANVAVDLQLRKMGVEALKERENDMIVTSSNEKTRSHLSLPGSAPSSNVTLITSHLNQKGSNSGGAIRLAETPPLRSSSKKKKSSPGDLKSNTSRSILGKRDASSNRKSTPKRGLASVVESSATSQKRTHLRKRVRTPTPSTIPSALLAPNPPASISTSVVNTISLGGNSNPHPASKMKKLHNNHKDTSIQDYFQKCKPTSITNNIAHQASSPSSPISNLDNNSSELERLRVQCQNLGKLCKDKDEQLKAVANNQTIMHATLKAALGQKEIQVLSLHRQCEEFRVLLEKKNQMANEAIEKLVRSEASRNGRELRQKLASDGARLGRIVHTRVGLQVVEGWEEGHEYKMMKKRRRELKRSRELLEERQKRVLPDGVHALDAIEAVESTKRHLDNLKKDEEALLSLEKDLRIEKNAHIRALKLLTSEDASRFKHKPKLHDRYILLSLLGKGGFSEVWRAYDLTEMRQVAVKVHQLDPRWSEAKKENYTKHVSREYEIHRDVRHPRIVSLYDVFEIDNDSFATVLECCKGTDLDTLLRIKGTLSEIEGRSILLQILLGMKYLSAPSEDGSRQGIIHYDLKPGNILFDKNGDAKITDFGLSKIVDGADALDSMELTSQGAGTYWYLPPECFVTHQSVRISNKVDVWAIGVIYYQLLFGKRPFGDGLSQDKILNNHTMLNARDVQFPSEPHVTEGCKDLIRACLTYDQTYRPSINQLCAHHYWKIELL